MIKLFVVIVTYKGKHWYDRCFSSLRQSSIRVKTVVVDNASNDGTVEYIRECYPEIHLIESKENLGFGRANNIGMRYAFDNGCDYVFLLNQDAWVEESTFENMIGIHLKHSEYGILSPIHLTASKNEIERGLINYLDDGRITDKLLFEDMYFGRLKEVYNTKYVNAAAWLLPRKTLEMVGGFDPIFSHYGEDDNYMQRVLFHNMRIGVCPFCIAVHDTERRITAAGKKKQTRDGVLLADFADINKRLNINELCFYYFRKAVLKFVTLKLPQAKVYWNDMRFLCMNAKAILNSRKANVVSGINWLT